MIFKLNQISELLKILERNTILYGVSLLGTDILSDYDKFLLKSYGIDIDSLKQSMTSFEAMYHFGVLSQALREQEVRKLKYSAFKRYLESGGYHKMSEREKDMFDIAKQRTYSHIKGLGEKQKQTVNGIILEEDQKAREAYEKVIGNAIKTGIQDRKSVQNIMLEIGNKTGDWRRDLGRIVDTEYNNVFQLGRAEEIKRRGGNDALVYKTVYPGACRHCISAYLTGGVGSQPKVFKISELETNGTNVGKKVADWLPVVGSHHPWCRCTLYTFFKGQEWNEEMQMFMYPEKKKD